MFVFIRFVIVGPFQAQKRGKVSVYLECSMFRQIIEMCSQQPNMCYTNDDIQSSLIVRIFPPLRFVRVCDLSEQVTFTVHNTKIM